MVLPLLKADPSILHALKATAEVFCQRNFHAKKKKEAKRILTEKSGG